MIASIRRALEKAEESTTSIIISITVIIAEIGVCCSRAEFRRARSLLR
jgi:hypothetical protein